MGGWVRCRSNCHAGIRGRQSVAVCYYKTDEFVNRPLTVQPTIEVAEHTGEVIETMASLARTFTADETEVLVDELGKEKILDCQYSPMNSARDASSTSFRREPAKVDSRGIYVQFLEEMKSIVSFNERYAHENA